MLFSETETKNNFSGFYKNHYKKINAQPFTLNLYVENRDVIVFCFEYKFDLWMSILLLQCVNLSRV